MNDLGYAVRRLRKQPGFTAVAILTLGLGMGATTAIYTVLERVVLDPLPYPEADRLVRLKSAVPGYAPGEEWDVSEGAWWFFGNEAASLETMAAYDRRGVNVQGPAGPERVTTAFVTAGTLRLIGARPAAGRLLDEQDDDPGAPIVTVLSHGFWQRRFGGDPGVVGKSVEVDERPVQIVGVMQRGVHLPSESGMSADLVETDFWLPLQLDPAGPFWNAHTRFRTIARLETGATLEEARRELGGLTARLPEAVPNAYSRGFMERYGFRTVVYPLKEYVVGDIASNLWILFGAVGVVLMIACANVANLFLVRIEGRRREIAIRGALGASGAAIARHFLAESVVLALAGGVVALLLAFSGVGWLAALAPEGMPRLPGVRPDGSVALFAFGLSFVVAAGLAAFPAIRYRRPVRVGELSEGGRGATVGRERQRVRSGLVVAQIALALVLVVGAGLLIESFRRLGAADPGIDPRGVVTMDLYLPAARYDGVPKMWRLYDDALRRIRALPGVEAAGLTSSLPLNDGFGCTVQGFEDPAVYERLAGADLTSCAGQEPTSPGYFEAMGIPVLRGRGLTQADHDDPARGVVVVSRAFAERFWPDEDPIGKGVGPNGRTNQRFYRVVGVVGDVHARSPAEAPALAIYYPVVRIPDTDGWWPNPMRLVVKTGIEDPVSMLPAIRRAVQEVDPAIPVANVEQMRTIVDRSMARLSFTMTLVGIAAAVALLLAAIGLYGVISYIVSRRTGEIGVRMALGARPWQLERLVVGGSLRLALLGLAGGTLAALALTRLLSGMLYDVRPTHPAAYAAAVTVLASVALLASWLPARRAARLDPVEALRAE